MVTLLQQVTAQNRAISGRVTDRQSGDGLPGVTVLLRGTTVGVSTNSDGTYTLSVPTSGGTLTFTSVGYITQERVIGSDNQVNIALAVDTKQLSEVVVTGYGGSQDVKDITGSIARIKEEKLLNQPVSSFDQALTGRAAGVQINSPGGTLADQSSIRIRGINSISNSSQPLIVVDGVPLNTLSNGNTFNSGNGTRYNPLADINPNDIQSVDVLKDAASAAIYGSRASNGVILITTKRGRSGQNHLSVNSFFGYQEATRLPKLLNGDDYITINNEKAANAAAANTARGTAFPSVIAKDIDVNGDGIPDRTNWLDQLYHKGVQQNYQVALSGGNELASYYGSADWSDQKGIIVKNALRRGSVRLNLDITPKKWLKGGISTSYSNTLNKGVLTDAYTAGVTVSGYNAAPNVPVYGTDGFYYLNPNGTLGTGNNSAAYIGTVYHPLANLELNRNQNTAQRILANGYVTVEPLTGLRLTSKYGIDYFQNFEDQYSDPAIAGLGRSYNGLVQDNLLTQNLWNWQNYANYSHTFGEQHLVDLTAGLEYQVENQRQIYTPAYDFSDPKFKDILDGTFAGSEFQAGGTRYQRGFQSYFARANYTFGNKYYFGASFRADADSRFGANNQRGYFPGVSAGWRISEEEFLKGFTLLNDLKLRASYGQVGNSNGLSAYASRSLIGGGQYATVNGLSIDQVGDPNIRWEKATKYDVGFDASILKDRIGITFDFFNNDISDLLLQAPVLRTTGIPNTTDYTSAFVYRNVGSMYNRGIELTLNTVNVRLENGFTWSSNINFSVIKNRVTTLATPSDINPGTTGGQRASVGKQLGVYYLPVWAGVDPANGRAMFKDANGNIKEYDPALAGTRPAGATSNLTGWFTTNGEATTAITASDYKYTKKGGFPTMFGGFDNTFSFKGLELGIFLQYSGGNLIYNQTRAALLTNNLNNNLQEIRDRWTTPGQKTDVPRLFLQNTTSTQASTRYLEKGDYLRLRQISLGYNVPKNLLPHLGNLYNLRIYALVQNAYVFTGYSGSDPEVNSARNTTGSNINYGTDNRSVPQPRSYTLGINIGI